MFLPPSSQKDVQKLECPKFAKNKIQKRGGGGRGESYVAPLRSENSDFLVKFKIAGEIKLGPYTEVETSDSSTLLERVIKVSNIGKRACTLHGMRGVLEILALV